MLGQRAAKAVKTGYVKGDVSARETVGVRR